MSKLFKVPFVELNTTLISTSKPGRLHTKLWAIGSKRDVNLEKVETSNSEIFETEI